MRIAVDERGVLIHGYEQELTDLASAILEAAVLGSVDEPFITEDGVATVRIRRADLDTEDPTGEDGEASSLDP